MRKCGPTFRKRNRRATGLGRQRRATRGGLCEPAASERSVWKAPATQERRTDRAELGALLRYRCNEQDPSARAPEHPQATVDSRRCVQSESDLPLSAGIWHPTGVEKPPVLPTFCAFSATPSLLSACEPHKVFLPAVPTLLAPK